MMEDNKAFEMFGYLDSKVQELLELDSCNVMIEEALRLGYDYAISESSEVEDGK